MRTFGRLLIREFQEWRNVFIILASLYILGLVGAAIGLRYLSDDILYHEGEVHIDWEDGGWDLYEADEMPDASRSAVLLFSWSHLLRAAVSMLNLVLMVVSVFYLVDAVYKERSDGSTLFYRSLPVSDIGVLSSKLTVGLAGFLLVSLVMSLFWVLFARLTFPGQAASVLKGMGYSPSQLALFDFMGDWSVFHFLVLLWALPYAAYFLFVSTATRSRPLLLGVGAPLLLGLLWLWISGGDSGLLALFTANLGAIADVLKEQWVGTGSRIYAGEPIELFGSFGGYIISMRTLISLLVAGGLFTATFYAYRRNLPVS
jgi:ABC-2 type transport system permease protein